MIRYLLFVLLLITSCTEKKETNYHTFEGDKLYKEGENLLLKDNFKAYLKFQQAIIFYTKYKDSSNISKSLICQAIAQKYTGDLSGSEGTLVEALKMMKENDESLYSIYGNLGDLKSDQKEYSDAIIWYDKALSKEIGDLNIKSTILNNKAVAEFKTNNFKLALTILQKIDLSIVTDKNLKTRIQDNIEYVKWLANNNYPAEEKLKKILEYKNQNNDSWGANSSFSHLAEIKQKSNPNISLLYAKKMLATAIKNKSPEDRLEAIEKIILVDNPVNFKKQFRTYKILSDSIQKIRNNYKNQFAYIKYDSEKKESENQQLKIQKAEKDIDVLYRNIGLAILSLLIIGGIFYYKKRKKRLQQEKELEVKNTELRYSKKVHDVVANGLYHMMIDIDNNPNINKMKILNDMEKMYEESRDISHEKSADIDFYERFGKMINSYSSLEQKVISTKYAENVWEKVSQNSQSELFYVIREILVNMKKHSGAKLVVLKFEKDEDALHITYTDNGKGIKNLTTQKGAGIRNTENRIDAIEGDIIFEENPTGGLIIKITIPIQKYV